MMNLHDRLYRPVEGISLAVFRMAFGTLMLFEALYRCYPNVDDYFAPGEFHFKFPLFEWVHPLPGVGMHLEALVMGAAAIGIALGFFYRASCAVFLITYTHFFLVEKATYNNHFYLAILLTVSLLVCNAHAYASLDSLRVRRKTTGWVPYWNVLLLRTQIAIVYIYGAIAKVNSDWFQGEPVRRWLANRDDYPFVGQFFTEEWCVYLFAYGGFLFDLLIVPALLIPRVRIAALIPLLFFHGMNKWLFNIGVFPVLAIASTILFFPPATPTWLFRRLGYVLPQPDSTRPHASGWLTRPNRTFQTCLVLFVAFQLLFPFRHVVYPGNPSWTEQGHDFAWHMKLRNKSGRATFKVVDAETGQIWDVDREEIRRLLTSRQRKHMTSRPHSILQFSHVLRDVAVAKGFTDPRVFADVKASLNGRPRQYLIDPEVDLAAESYSLFGRNDWIVPLKPDVPIGRY